MDKFIYSPDLYEITQLLHTYEKEGRYLFDLDRHDEDDIRAIKRGLVGLWEAWLKSKPIPWSEQVALLLIPDKMYYRDFYITQELAHREGENFIENHVIVAVDFEDLKEKIDDWYKNN